jgi:hypothetical protein
MTVVEEYPSPKRVLALKCRNRLRREAVWLRREILLPGNEGQKKRMRDNRILSFSPK